MKPKIRLPLSRNQNHAKTTQKSKTPTESLGKSRINEFKKVELLGRGTYGKVFKAYDRRTDRHVAVKQLKMEKEKEGFPITAIREVKSLKLLKHPNIVRLFDIIASIKKAKFWMIFEYVEHDLMGLLNASIPFDESMCKSLMKQLLKGLQFMHEMKIIHRDLKTSNLLITRDGILKIADFGLCRMLQMERKEYTNRVVTRWYRAPELLLGQTDYGFEIDMWSVGCIFAEILEGGRSLFRGNDELDQLHKIFEIVGTPSKSRWPDVVKLRNWREMNPKKTFQPRLKSMFKEKDVVSDLGIDLLVKLLELDPKKRITTAEALDHRWFRDPRIPERRPMNLPRNGNFNELRVHLGSDHNGGGRNGGYQRGMDRGAISKKRKWNPNENLNEERERKRRRLNSSSSHSSNHFYSSYNRNHGPSDDRNRNSRNFRDGGNRSRQWDYRERGNYYSSYPSYDRRDNRNYHDRSRERRR